MEQVLRIGEFILKSFIHIWPYLLITIPLAVLVNLSGAAKYINKALSKKPMVAIILATLVGAISPFCSCGVIPVIASLLIGGVPLAPVMAFWIASPSMDPEIFLLSAATIGWKLSIWRLAATFVISISAGILTHFAQKQGFFGNDILRSNSHVIRENPLFKKRMVQLAGISNKQAGNVTMNCCVPVPDPPLSVTKEVGGCSCEKAEIATEPKLSVTILKETWKAFSMVAKFMTLAFLINALIQFYVPQDLITGLIGGDNSFPVLVAALIGIPFYTSNITALPLVSGFLSLGMNPGAALAFLIAGPVTTLPAMMAVWGIVKPRVFFVYLAISFAGSVLVGFAYNLVY